MMTIDEKIKKCINENKVVLFMKGNANLPMCGFSAKAVHVLKECAIPFVTVDVLQDEEMRQGIKVFSNWPTIPQLYINGEFIGGCDILNEMYNAGELQPLLAKAL